MNRNSLVFGVLLPAACASVAPERPTPRGPNVIIVMTDDQGWGDFGFQGNSVIHTPNLDAMAAESAQLATFYVSPVCAPTRAALMTGRYCQRTRAIDTYIGRAMMEPDEVTIAEVLRDAGWATGIFGKWHLGDCYPMRAMDQGFEESLVHRGGGIGQSSDPEGGEAKYTDAILFHNGVETRTSGYCTDVYFDAALEWMRSEQAADRPFFAYIATNAPHGPFGDVPAAEYADLSARDLSPAAFPAAAGHALPAKHDEDRLARIFAMIENIDANVGRLFAGLEEMGALEDTLVLFLVDNGPNSRRWVRGMRGMKTEVYEGGIRSPLLAHWPGHLPARSVPNVIGAHIDIMPTVLEACGVALPDGVELDGVSLLPALRNDTISSPERTITIQAHRGNEAVRYHNFMARTPGWKLVNASGFHEELASVKPRFELYDMRADPLELVDVAAEHPDVVARMRAEYDAWFDDVGSTRADNYAPPRIVIGSDAAPEVVLTRQDWRRERDDGRPYGHWEVRVQSPGPYRVRVRFPKNAKVQSVTLRLGEFAQTEAAHAGASEHTFESVRLKVGEGPLEVVLEGEDGALGAYQVFFVPV